MIRFEDIKNNPAIRTYIRKADDSLKAFEEGVSLVNKCNSILNEAEQKVKILVAGPDGTLEKTDFKPN